MIFSFFLPRSGSKSTLEYLLNAVDLQSLFFGKSCPHLVNYLSLMRGVMWLYLDYFDHPGSQSFLFLLAPGVLFLWISTITLLVCDTLLEFFSSILWPVRPTGLCHWGCSSIFLKHELHVFSMNYFQVFRNSLILISVFVPPQIGPARDLSL